MGKFKNSFLSVEETAQLTVMLSLLIFILLTFAAAVLESASIQTSKNMRRMDVERAVESVFAEYQKELLEEYDIFGLDGTYQSGTYSEERVTDRMTVYGALSGENQVEGIRFLSDGNGQEFAEQVIRYVENRFGVDLLKELAGKEEEAQEQEAEAEDYHRQEEETEKKMDELLASGEASPEVSEEGEETENPLGILQKLKRKVLTELVLPKDRSISQKSMEGMPGVSGRERRTGKGSMPSWEAKQSEKLYFIAYIPEHFGSYIEPGEDHPLEYEQEYLIGGSPDDMENLQEVLGRIRNLRMAPNYIYLQSDETKKAEVRILAGVVSTLLGNPELTDVVSQMILMVWAYGESIMDLRTLTSGGRVPATKSGETWKLSLSGLLKLGTSEDSGSGGAGESGMKYEDYLKILLFLESKETLSMRMLDLIEWNMKTRLNCPSFEADACITKMRIQSICSLRRGITYQFSTYYAYH